MRSGMFHTTINDTEIFVTCSINGPCVKLTVSAFFESDLSVQSDAGNEKRAGFAFNGCL